MNHKDNFDELLFSSLKSEEKPSESLNIMLKNNIKAQQKHKVISLWWIPLVISVLFSSIALVLIFLFVSDTIIQFVLSLISILLVIACFVFTIICVKHFNLKEGASITL